MRFEQALIEEALPDYEDFLAGRHICDIETLFTIVWNADQYEATYVLKCLVSISVDLAGFVPRFRQLNFKVVENGEAGPPELVRWGLGWHGSHFLCRPRTCLGLS